MAEHPETRKGEKFLINAKEVSFRAIGHKSKRRGNQAYDLHGQPIEKCSGIFPVFISVQDWEEHQQYLAKRSA